MQPHHPPHPQAAPLPPMTEYELSQHLAQAGMSARAEAANLPGDPAQLMALMRAGSAQPAPTREHAEVVNGLPLYPLNLAVTLATTELGRLCQKLADAPSEVQTILRMVVCFHRPAMAYQTLQHGPEGLAALDAEGFKLAGHWGIPEMTAFGQFIARVKAQSPSTQAAPPPAPPPGKPKRGGKARR